MQTNKPKDYYRTLGVGRDASAAEIKRKFRVLQMLFELQGD